MLTCIMGSKKSLRQQDEHNNVSRTFKKAIKVFTSLFKAIRLKSCKPCFGYPDHSGVRNYAYSETGRSQRCPWDTRLDRFFSGLNTPASPSGQVSPVFCSGQGTLSRQTSYAPQHNPASSGGQGTPATLSRQTSHAFMEEDEKWIAQVEHGVFIHFISLPHDQNKIKRLHFSGRVFSTSQAQRWWAENYDDITERYNVQGGFFPIDFTLQTPTRLSEDEITRIESSEGSSSTSRLSKDGGLPLNSRHQNDKGYSNSSTPRLSTDGGLPLDLRHQNDKGYSFSDSLDRQTLRTCHYQDSTLNLPGSVDASVETERVDASAGSSDTDIEINERVQDEPGVHVTIRLLPSGKRQLKRIQFSQETFDELHASLWWEENQERIQRQYL